MGAGCAEYRRLVQIAESDELVGQVSRRGLQVVFGVLLLGLVIFVATRQPRKPTMQKWALNERKQEQRAERSRLERQRAADVALVKGLLRENLSDREFDFPVVVEAVSGKKVLPLKGRASEARIVKSIDHVMREVLLTMNDKQSPARGVGRINEVSSLFEQALREELHVLPGIRCEIPPTRSGIAQRSGYPDLQITDEATGEIYYLDPKLMVEKSLSSQFRSFYFEPKNETLKVTEDAVHLLLGIQHNGVNGDWRFLRYRLIDLSSLKVRLKAEFQASNREIYGGVTVLEIEAPEGEDTSR